VNADTAKRLDNIARIDCEMRELAEVMGPLTRFLMPKTFAYAKAGGSVGGFSIHLCVEDWPKQYEFMMREWGSRCLGVDITWFKRFKPSLRDRYIMSMQRECRLVRQREDEAIMRELCGMPVVIRVDPTMPPGTMKLIAGPRPKQQVTITGLAE
jgi:hypothetical protein